MSLVEGFLVLWPELHPHSGSLVRRPRDHAQMALPSTIGQAKLCLLSGPQRAAENIDFESGTEEAS